MNIHIIIIILFTHWIADFLFQSDEIALTKSTSWYSLSYHVGIYTLLLGLSLSFFFKLENVALYSVINGGAHFIIDAITSRLNSIFWKNDDRHSFFCCVGLDQFYHVLILMVSLPCLSRCFDVLYN